MADPGDDYDDGDPVQDCPNCGGEGFVACCFEEYACVDPESGCDACMRPCDWCRPLRPPKPSPSPAGANTGD